MPPYSLDVEMNEITATCTPYNNWEVYFMPANYKLPTKIEKIIYNGPATVVFFNDGTKSVVKCSENDNFDPEKGVAMACMKRLLGNKGSYYNNFRKVEIYTERKEEKR